MVSGYSQLILKGISMNQKSFYIPENLNLRPLLSLYYPNMVKHIDKFHYVINHLYVTKFLDKRYSNVTQVLPYSSLSTMSLNPGYVLSLSSNLLSINISDNHLFSSSFPSLYSPYDITFSEGLIPSQFEAIPFYGITVLKGCRSTKTKYEHLSKLSKRVRKKQYIPLQMAHLQAVLTTKLARHILATLEALNIVEIDHQYTPAQRSKGYRLAPQFHNQKFIKVDIFDSKFGDKLSRIGGKHFLSLSKLHQELFNMLGDYHLDEQAIHKVDNTLNLQAFERCSAELAIDKIRCKDFFFSTDPKTGRIFHNLCNLKSEYRECIRDSNNLPMVEIDISNSQPFFLSLLLRQENITGIDVDLYNQLTRDGQLYDYIAAQGQMERSYVKSQILTMFFSENSWTFKLKSTFMSLFPTVHKAIEQIKATHHNALALQLQKQEADFIIGTLSPMLIAKGVSFVTIHDSIMVSYKIGAEVLELMRKAFDNCYGVIPNLKLST
jgi:hypothetical protein